MCDQRTSVDSAFKMADDVLTRGVQAISEVITVPGVINLDFADIKAIMKEAGPAWMSIGKGTGAHRAVDAAKDALGSPLLDVSINGATGVLFNIVGDQTLTLFEVNEAAKVIKQAVHSEANIIFGVAHESELNGEVRITLIATGFGGRGSIWGSSSDAELTEYLHSLKQSEEEMDQPSFLRRPSFGQRRDWSAVQGTQKQNTQATQKASAKQ
jgi:cell division protein FtsZ